MKLASPHLHTIGWLIVNIKSQNLYWQARELNKFAWHIFIFYVCEILKFIGRIHGEINQLRSDQGGTVSGRLSMGNPNSQQIPARNKDFGPKIRSLFIPASRVISGAAIDYSQQEPPE